MAHFMYNSLVIGYGRIYNNFIVHIVCGKEEAMFDMAAVGRKISELRKKNNMTQLELADKMGVSFQAVSNWERGD